MSRQNAISAKQLPLGERNARVARMVESGEISVTQAAKIDFREPSARAREFAETLAPRAKEFLTKGSRAAA